MQRSGFPRIKPPVKITSFQRAVVRHKLWLSNISTQPHQTKGRCEHSGYNHATDGGTALRAGYTRASVGGQRAYLCYARRRCTVRCCRDLLLITIIADSRSFDICAGCLFHGSGNSRADGIFHPRRTKIVVGVAQRSHLDYSLRHDLATPAIQFLMGARATDRNWNAGDGCNRLDEGDWNAQG